MKNIVLITIDCLRYDSFNTHAPNLMKYGKQGWFFKRAYSLGSWTTPSLLGLLTSTYPLMYNGKLAIEYPRISIVDILKSQGYSTLGFTFHPYLSSLYKFNKGFDIYYDSLIKKSKLEEKNDYSLFKEIIKKVIYSDKTPKYFKNYAWLIMLHRKLKKGNLPYLRGEQVNNMVKEHLDGVSEPFFLWIHYLDTHFPYVPRSNKISSEEIVNLNEERERWFKLNKRVDYDKLLKLKNLYLLTIKDVDNHVKEIVEYFKRKNFYKNTIFIITADHGEEFYEHGGFHHEIKLYEELIHVPLIMFGNGLKPKIIEKVVSHIGVFPTILDILGLKSPAEFIGKNMILNDSNLSFVEEGQKYHGDAFKGNLIKLDLNSAKIAIIYKNWKYIRGDDSLEIYNLQDDPLEKNNLITHKDKYRDILRTFNKLYAEHIKLLKNYSKEKFIIHKLSKEIQRGAGNGP